MLGPGLITGASDDDPSGIGTYAQAGAQTGLTMAWTALVTFPLMAAVQEICDRTALVTGKSLGTLARERFARRGRSVLAVLLVGLLLANALNIAADLVAVGAGLHLLHLGPAGVWTPVAGVAISGVLMLGHFPLLSKVFRWLTMSLLAYPLVAFLDGPGLGATAKALLIPHLPTSRADIALLVAILGTTISPYLFVWQTANRIEEMRAEPAGGPGRVVALAQRSKADEERKERSSRVDVFVGMAFSNLVMFAIIVSTSSTLHAHHQLTIASAAQAATALKPIAGSYAGVLFAIGFIGAGMLAVPVLAGAGSVGIAGLLGKPWGLSRSPRQAPLFYLLLLAGTLGGTALSLLAINPIRLLVLSASINGAIAAPFLVLVMLLSSDKTLMGSRRNGRLAAVLGWGTTVVMSAATVAYFVTL